MNTAVADTNTLVGVCGMACHVCRYNITGECACLANNCRGENKLATRHCCPIAQCAHEHQIAICSCECREYPCGKVRQYFPYHWTRQVVRTAQTDSISAPGVAGIQAVEQPPTVRTLPALMRVQCFGEFQVYRGMHLIQSDEWGSEHAPAQHVKSLFCYLISRGNEGAGKDRIINLLWPKRSLPDRKAAEVAFFSTLYHLYRVLEPELATGKSSRYIIDDGSTYRFQPQAPYWIDVARFSHHIRIAQMYEQAGDSQKATISWDRAIGLYRGRYMARLETTGPAGCSFGWCIALRERYERLYLDANMAVATYYSEQKSHDLAIAYATEAIRTEPQHEGAHILLMKCLIANGQLNGSVLQSLEWETGLAIEQDTILKKDAYQAYRDLLADLIYNPPKIGLARQSTELTS